MSFIGVAAAAGARSPPTPIAGRPLVLVDPSDRVLRLLDLCGERDVFEIRGPRSRSDRHYGEAMAAVAASVQLARGDGWAVAATRRPVVDAVGPSAPTG